MRSRPAWRRRRDKPQQPISPTLQPAGWISICTIRRKCEGFASVLRPCVVRPSAGRLPDSEQQIAAGAGQIVAVYLRAAQAYMLISMPTGTSTIFGVFHVIQVSQL